MDGNKKLWPWIFYVHRCIDGHLRLIIYLVCCNNKKSSTVEAIFMAGLQNMAGQVKEEVIMEEKTMVLKGG